MCAEILQQDGIVYLRTDDLDYYQQMREVFGACALYKEIETPQALQSVITDFERGFLSRGVQTNRAAYQLIRR